MDKPNKELNCNCSHEGQEIILGLFITCQHSLYLHGIGLFSAYEKDSPYKHPSFVAGFQTPAVERGQMKDHICYWNTGG